ncbi:MAG: hypothetical protein JNN07_23695 [Verrucomicrobiales bacterium]|nr:hypothetical protein [Verrucomicrobiales bacterium]
MLAKPLAIPAAESSAIAIGVWKFYRGNSGKSGSTLLEAIVRCIKADFQVSPYMQLDETPIKYLDPANGECSQGSSYGFQTWKLSVPLETLPAQPPGWYSSYRIPTVKPDLKGSE